MGRSIQHQGGCILKDKRVWGPKPNYPNVRKAKGWHKGEMIAVAGPCSVESQHQLITIAKKLKLLGIKYLRGGVFTAGTYPPLGGISFRSPSFGFMQDIAVKYGLKTVVEIVDRQELEWIYSESDCVQVGARHMQDYFMLDALKDFKGEVFLKRNMGATLDEFLGAAEYLERGSCKVVLVERGSSTHMNHVRWDLSISIIPAIKAITGLPVIVDASHGTGRRDLVEPMTYAGMAAGADGYLVEVHPKPDESWSDAEQALPLKDLDRIDYNCEMIHETLYKKKGKK